MKMVQDRFWEGRLVVWQPARGEGYRFTLDPVLLAGVAPVAGEVLDLGAGCGIIGLLLLGMRKVQRVVAVEVQPELAAVAQRNAEANGFAAHMQVEATDVRRLAAGRFDLVVFNPPYFRAGSGRGAPVGGRDVARHERLGGLDDFVAAAAQHLRPDGAMLTIVPKERLQELEGLCHAAGLGVAWHRGVRSRRTTAVRHVLALARRGAAGAGDAAEDLIVHADQGRAFRPEVAEWLSGPVDGLSTPAASSAEMPRGSPHR